MPDVDVVVIGAGAAGLGVATVAAALGLKTALIERGVMGGDCLNYGSVPSKALLAVAHRAAEARDGARFGLHLGDPVVDWTGVRAHVAGAIARIAPGASTHRLRAMGVEVIQAAAHFTAPDEIEAGARRIRFRRAVIAAGSAAVVPDIPGLGDIAFLTHETLFDLADRPEHLVILGDSPTGLEMAQAHARLGSRVTVVEAATIARHDDPECVAALRLALARDGVAVVEGVRVVRVGRDGAGLIVTLDDGQAIAGTHLLLALGQAPRLGGLDLAAGRIAATPHGIATDRALRSTSNRRVWAAGDIADPEGLGPRAFTHVASQHAPLIARAMLFRLPARLEYDALPRVIFTDPEIAQIGPTEAEARAAGIEGLTILRWPMAENDRLIAEGRAEGLVKFIVSRRGRLIGASLVGPRAGELAATLGLMIGRRIPLSALAALIVPYPTAGEALKRAASEFFTPKLLSPFMKKLAGLLKRLP